jgi:hypothetical protein
MNGNSKNNLTVLTVNGKLGVDNIVTVFVVFMMLVTYIRDLIKDFSLSKLVTLGLEIVKYGNIIVVGRMALAEFKDLEPGESEEAKQRIIEQFDIPDDKFEAELEGALDLVEETYDVFVSGLTTISKWKGFISTLRGSDPAKVAA